MCNRFLRYLEGQFFCCLGHVSENNSSDERSDSRDDESYSASSRDDNSSNEKASYQNESDEESQEEDVVESTGSQETQGSKDCSSKFTGSVKSIASEDGKPHDTSKRLASTNPQVKHVTISRHVQTMKRKQSIKSEIKADHKAIHQKEKEKKKGCEEKRTEKILRKNSKQKKNNREERVSDQKKNTPLNSNEGKLATNYKENKNSKVDKRGKNIGNIGKKPEQLVRKERLNDKPNLSKSRKFKKERSHPSFTTRPLSRRFPSQSVKKQGSPSRVGIPKRR